MHQQKRIWTSFFEKKINKYDNDRNIEVRVKRKRPKLGYNSTGIALAHPMAGPVIWSQADGGGSNWQRGCKLSIQASIRDLIHTNEKI